MFSCFKDKIFLKRFIQIALPVMISAFISFLVSFLDNIMVGTVSNEAVSGVYAANEVTFLFNLASFGILEAAGIFIEQFNGAKDNKRLKECYMYKILISIVFLIIVIPAVYLFGTKLVHVFCKSDAYYTEIMKQGKSYLYIIAISYIPFMIGYIYSTSLREIGKTKYAMISSIIAVFVNTIFNFIFIMVLKWGVKGAALATIISRIIEMLYLIIISYAKKFEFCYGKISEFKISSSLFKKITSKGWLLFINEVGYATGVMLQSLAFSQRDSVLSSISIVTTISNIFMILINGVSVGIGVMVGGDLGASDYKKAKDDSKKLNWLSLWLSIFIGVILISISRYIPYMFSKVDSSQKLLSTKLIIIYSSLLWASNLAVVSYYTLRVGGKTILTFIFDTGTMAFLFVPLSWILAVLTNLDMLYIYLIIRSIDIFKAILGVILMKKGSWVVNLTLDNDY